MRKRNGFTIIEMLVTIAIITVITAVEVFSITTYINNTKESSDELNIKSIKESAELYVKEFDNDIIWIDNRYTCISVKQLKDIGLIKKKIKIYNKDIIIEDNTKIKVEKDKDNSSITEINIDDKECKENA